MHVIDSFVAEHGHELNSLVFAGGEHVDAGDHVVAGGGEHVVSGG